MKKTIKIILISTLILLIIILFLLSSITLQPLEQKEDKIEMGEAGLPIEPLSTPPSLEDINPSGLPSP